jgi:FtsP/CotA-like multicopper oxidase with cupredoxin domain
MAAYVWSLNGQVWPKITPLEVKQGERVELTFVNQTMMTHPMHLHGHVFQVTEVGGARLRGRQARHGPRVTPADGEGRVRRPLSRLLDDPLPSALSPGGRE